MNANALLASLLLITACGTVAPDTVTGDDAPDFDGGIDASDDSGSESPPDAPQTPEPDAPPSAMLPMFVELAHQATSPTSLAVVTFASPATMVDIIESSGPDARYDIIEQRIVPTTAGPLPIEIDVAAPTGTFSRSFVSDSVFPLVPWAPVWYLCSENNVSTGDPRCTTQPPTTGLTQTTGAIAYGRWRVYVVDEGTNTKLDSCVATGLHLECVLPNPIGATYRIVVAADGFSDLWEGSSPMRIRQIGADGGVVVEYLGAQGPDIYQCTHFTGEPATSRVWCDNYVFSRRLYGLDTATLAFDPMHVTISAGGATKTFHGPTITWSPGNQDLIGPTF